MRPFGLIAASLLACAGVPASAQTFGPSIPGVCLLSRTAAIAASGAGRSMQAQLREMQASLSGELSQRRTALEQQRRQLEAQQGTIAPIEYQRLQAEIARQVQLIDENQNGRFIAAQTRGQQQIDRTLGTALARVITRTACSVVLERDQSYGWNNAMDVTHAVVEEMDAILPTVATQ